MININQKLVALLDDSEMWVVIHIANVLNKDTNDVDLMNQTLVKKTGYSLVKINRIKASLAAKKVLKITSRKRFDGGTACNNYAINSKFVTLYLGKKQEDTPPIEKQGGLCPNDIGGEYPKQEGGGYQNEYPLYTPIEFTKPIEFNCPIEETPTPFKGDISLKKNDDVFTEPKKSRSKKTPGPKFTPDLSAYDENTQGLILEWIEHRAALDKHIKTQYAISRFVAELRRLADGSFNKAKELVEYMRYREWQTVNPIPQNYQKNGKNQPTHEQRIEKTYDTASAAIEYIEREAARKAESERRRSEPGGN